MTIEIVKGIFKNHLIENMARATVCITRSRNDYVVIDALRPDDVDNLFLGESPVLLASVIGATGEVRWFASAWKGEDMSEDEREAADAFGLTFEPTAVEEDEEPGVDLFEVVTCDEWVEPVAEYLIEGKAQRHADHYNANFSRGGEDDLRVAGRRVSGIAGQRVNIDGGIVGYQFSRTVHGSRTEVRKVRALNWEGDDLFGEVTFKGRRVRVIYNDIFDNWATVSVVGFID